MSQKANSAPRITLLGGTGYVGRAIARQLVERHAGSGRIVVPTRRLSHGAALRPLPTVELVEADVFDAERLPQLLAGSDAVVNLIAILHGTTSQFARTHVELPRRIAAACQQAKVRRLVHLSSLGVGPGAPSNYLRSKTEGEAVLQAAGLDLTMLRPSVIFGAEDRFLNLFAELQAVAPVVPLAGSGSRYQPVWVEDVARAVLACLDRPETIGQVYECTGPNVYTLGELARLAGGWAGHARPQIPLPEGIGRLQARVMQMLPGPTLMSLDNIDSMKTPNIASGKVPGLVALGIVPIALEAVAPGYLAPGQGRARYDRFRAGRP